MQYAMEKLQERFTRTMSEVAELTDEKQRLEHLVLQLQGETETIGEAWMDLISKSLFCRSMV